MKLRSSTLALSILMLAAACQKSEISDKPAAEVSDTGATITSDSTSTEAGTVAGNVIKEKSSMNWVAGKVTRDHNGAFKNFDGSIQYVGDKPNAIHFEIDLTSVEADEPKLTEHLKSPDFFDVARFPKATFRSTSLNPAPAGSPPGVTHMLKGTLDLHGVQKEVTIPVTAEVTPEGVLARSEFTINRHDWGISYRGRRRERQIELDQHVVPDQVIGHARGVVSSGRDKHLRNAKSRRLFDCARSTSAGSAFRNVPSIPHAAVVRRHHEHLT